MKGEVERDHPDSGAMDVLVEVGSVSSAAGAILTPAGGTTMIYLSDDDRPTEVRPDSYRSSPRTSYDSMTGVTAPERRPSPRRASTR